MLKYPHLKTKSATCCLFYCTLFIMAGMFAYVAELAPKSELCTCSLKVVSGTWLCPEMGNFLYLWKHGH
jgi:hypothetical protein